MTEDDAGQALRGMARAAEITGIAGGVVSLSVGVLVTASVLGRWLLDQGVPGDFEFVKMGAALTVFFFLPACQARRGNIVVDTFTGFLSPVARARIDALWDIIYGLAMAAIGACMVVGTLESFKTHTTTMVLLLPVWPVLLVCTLLLFFLALVCLWTARCLMAVH